MKTTEKSLVFFFNLYIVVYLIERLSLSLVDTYLIKNIRNHFLPIAIYPVCCFGCTLLRLRVQFCVVTCLHFLTHCLLSKCMFIHPSPDLFTLLPVK